MMTRADWIAVLLAVALLPGFYLRHRGDADRAEAVRIPEAGLP